MDSKQINSPDPRESWLLISAEPQFAVMMSFKRMTRFTEEEVKDQGRLYIFRVDLLVLIKYKSLIHPTLSPSSIISLYKKLTGADRSQINEDAYEDMDTLIYILQKDFGMREH